MKVVKVDPMNRAFAVTMEILTYIGLVLMIVPGVIYIFTSSGFVNVTDVIQNWDKPASEFWKEVKGIKISGYSWFLSNLTYMDCLSLVGIVFLALAPLAAIIASITKADSKYKVILAIIVIEFVFAVVRPLIMHAVGH